MEADLACLLERRRLASAACGNATRCIARHLMDETGGALTLIRTERGLLQAAGRGRRADLGQHGPPLPTGGDPAGRRGGHAAPADRGRSGRHRHGQPALHLLRRGCRGGRPRARSARDEHHPLFPERTNVQFARSRPGPPAHAGLGTGTGITLASGSSSCAVAVAAARRGLTGRKVTITLDGGASRRLARGRRLDDRADRACLSTAC
jgi:diaminopimelate epimerase